VAAAVFVGFAVGAAAQTIDCRQWQGSTAMTRQPEQVYASTMAEWRSLWSRVGVRAPDQFEPGRTSAIGIFLGARSGMGYSVNILSTVRRRDRIMVVFQERVPRNVPNNDTVTTQALQAPLPSPRPVAGGSPSGPPGGGGAMGFAPGGGASGFVPPNSMASLAPPPARPVIPLSSPWAIVLINRADLPVSVEQRLF